MNKAVKKITKQLSVVAKKRTKRSKASSLTQSKKLPVTARQGTNYAKPKKVSVTGMQSTSLKTQVLKELGKASAPVVIPNPLVNSALNTTTTTFMFEEKGGKIFLLVDHHKYLNPIKEAPRLQINVPRFKKAPGVYYVYDLTVGKK